jgi:hypothetical protein
MFSRRTLLITACSLFLLHQPDAYAQRSRGGQWEYLGQSRVDGSSDHDNIKVGRGEGIFRMIQLRVEDAPVEFDRVVVHYANGGDEEVRIRQKVAAGGMTRAIDLRGGERALKSVEVWYGRAREGSRRPVLRLYGRR